MKKVMIYTDGACSGNPGIGGWAAILFYNGHEKVISGGSRDTTNNRMELFAIIEALRQLKEKCEVEIYSDSAYCVNAISSGWLEKWQINGWKSSAKEPVKNKDLWTDYILRAKGHKITFIKVEGHSGDEYNEKCDKLAKSEITNISKSLPNPFPIK